MPENTAPPYVVIRARELRQSQTAAEQALWARLRNRQLTKAKFRRQHPIGRYIADFYCHEARLVIELEGDVHDQSFQQEYDLVRRKSLEGTGIRVLAFKNDQIFQDLESVIATIANALTLDQDSA